MREKYCNNCERLEFELQDQKRQTIENGEAYAECKAELAAARAERDELALRDSHWGETTTLVIELRAELKSMTAQYRGKVSELLKEVERHEETWAEMKKWKPYLHWCGDWDGLLIDQDDVEFESCTCFKNKPPRDSFRTVLEERDRWREMAGKLAEALGRIESSAIKNHIAAGEYNFEFDPFSGGAALAEFERMSKGEG